MLPVFKIVFSLVIGILISFQGNAITKFDEGIDYKVFKKQNDFTKSKPIEVIEFFMFGCPHCKSFYPKLTSWADRQDPLVDFKKYHVPFRELNHQRMFFS